MSDKYIDGCAINDVETTIPGTRSRRSGICLGPNATLIISDKGGRWFGTIEHYQGGWPGHQYLARGSRRKLVRDARKLYQTVVSPIVAAAKRKRAKDTRETIAIAKAAQASH